MDLHQTDPEFAERFAYFAFQEVINEENQQLDEKTRYMAISAALIGCGAVDAYREMLPRALENGLTPIAVKEIVYQATDYLGLWPNAALSAMSQMKRIDREGHRASARRAGNDHP